MIDICILILVELHLQANVLSTNVFLAPAIVAGAVTLGVLKRY